MVNTAIILKYLNIDFFQIYREDTQKYCESQQARPNMRFYGGHWLAEVNGSAMSERASWPLGQPEMNKSSESTKCQSYKCCHIQICKHLCVKRGYGTALLIHIDNTVAVILLVFYYWLMLDIVFEFVLYIAHDLHTNTHLFFSWMLLQKNQYVTLGANCQTV